MSLLSRLFRRLETKKATRPRISTVRHRARPALESLEDRCVPTSGLSTIQSNFNGTAIPAGDSLWFNSVFKANGLGSSPVTLHVTNQTIVFSANGTTYHLNVPDDTITFSPTATTATTSFDTTSNSWVTMLPFHFSGNGFLGGAVFMAANGLPGGIHNVTWQATLSSDTAGVSVNWQWAAAVYTHFSTDYNALGVKPVDDTQASSYKNSDHAGTPENGNFKTYVTGGATGGGGSNWTGSYSATASITPPVVTQPPASVSGFVYNGTQGGTIAGVQLTLSELINGQMVSIATTTTAANGSYSFTNLQPGIYTITQTPPPPPSGFVSESSTGQVGTVNGVTDGSGGSSSDVLTNINLTFGNNGLNYNFTDFFAGS
jgi:hypothetical protein